MAGRRGSTRRKILFTFVTLLLGFVALDTASRAVRARLRQPGQEAIFEPDPVLGRRHVKNAKAVVAEWSKPTPNRVSINQFGFRGPTPRTLEKPRGMIRILASGGSTTEDIFVDDGRTWPEQLQAKLNERLHTDRIEVVNMGTSGYTAENCVKDLKLHGLALQPDLVIAYHGVNDFRKAMQKLNDLEEVEAYAKYERRETAWWSRLLCLSSMFDQVNRLNYYRGGERNRAYTLAYWNDPDKVGADLDGIDAPVLAALTELRELSEEHRFQLVIGRQATLMKPELTEEEVARMWRIFLWKRQGKCVKWEAFLEGRQRVIEAQARFAEQNGVLYIDTESAVPKSVDYFVDDAHTFGNGADQISERFADGLIRAGVLQRLLVQGDNPDEGRAVQLVAGAGEPRCDSSVR
jgi:hypothetical protein